MFRQALLLMIIPDLQKQLKHKDLRQKRARAIFLLTSESQMSLETRTTLLYPSFTSRLSKLWAPEAFLLSEHPHLILLNTANGIRNVTHFLRMLPTSQDLSNWIAYCTCICIRHSCHRTSPLSSPPARGNHTICEFHGVKRAIPGSPSPPLSCPLVTERKQGCVCGHLEKEKTRSLAQGNSLEVGCPARSVNPRAILTTELILYASCHNGIIKSTLV